MANANTGIVSAADLQTILDKGGSWFKSQYAALGLGAPSESTTLAAKAIALRNGIMGDGSSIYGIQNSRFQTLVGQDLDQICLNSRWDAFFSTLAGYRNILSKLNNFVTINLPYRNTNASDQWKFTNTDGRLPLDMYLSYLNANDPSNTPATPSFTPSVTATTGGAIAPTTSGAEPRIKVCAVGSQDYFTSQPSAASSQVALSGANNAYSIAAPAGNVPNGVTKYRFFRQLDNNAGASDPYYWDSDLTVVAGNAHSTYFPYKLIHSDQELDQNWKPPVYSQLCLLPEEAALINLLLAAPSPNPGKSGQLFIFPSNAFLQVYNCTLNPANAFTGYNFPSSGAQFGQWVAGTYTAGTIINSTTASLGQQGVGGSIGGIQARVTSALGSTYSTTITYNYYDASNPTTLQTGAVSGSKTFSATTVGTTLDFTITAGRYVTAITAISLGAGSGTFVLEGIPARSI